jgi:hypothetical protein
MSKRLPYFQFEPAEYLAGDIMFCSYSAQGIFNTICALYWQKDCDLKYSQVIKRLGNEDLLTELINEKIIKVENDSIIINFLDEQYLKATEKSKVNSSNGSKGALKRWAKNSESNSEIIATPLKNDSESIALREDKIKEYKINNIEERKLKFANTLKPFVDIYGRDLVKEFYEYWTEPNKSNTKFKQELLKTWSVERRLETWSKNDNNFNKNKNGKSNITDTEQFKDLTKAIRSTGDRI